MNKLILFMFLPVLAGCPSPEPKGPTPIPRDTDVCEEAGANLEHLQCRDRNGDPMWVNKNGEPFAETCRIAQEEGRIFLNPKCVAGASTCEEAKSCPPSSE